MSKVVGDDEVGIPVDSQFKYQIIVWIRRERTVVVDDFDCLRDIFQIIDQAFYPVKS